MIAVSAAFLALLGVGYLILPSDDDESTTNDAPVDMDETPEDVLQDDPEIVPFDQFMQSASSLEEHMEMSNQQVHDASVGSVAFTDEQSGPEQTEPETPSKAKAGPEPDQNDTGDGASSKVIAGGPGDTLVGSQELDTFLVTVGEQGDPTTTIQNLFQVDRSANSNGSATGAEIEKIWLYDEKGEALSREYLFAAELHLDEDEKRGGVIMTLNGHETLFIENVTLLDFVDNSLVLGNFLGVAVR